MRVKRGYTILEVMMFIAISAAIFTGAVRAIGGRQAQVQFSQAVREFEAKIRDVANDVVTGYYPANETVTCELSVGKSRIVKTNDASLGTNSGCIYIGKVLQFQPDGKKERMDIYTMAGLRYEDQIELTPSTSIAKSDPVPVSLVTADEGFHDPTSSYNLLYGLQVKKVIRPSASPVEYGAVAIMTNFGASGVSDIQTAQIGGVVGSQLGQTKASVLTLLDELTDDPARIGDSGYLEKNTSEGIVICLEDVSGKLASVSFGVSGNISTRLDIDSYDRRCDS
ncbi:MAG TPA: hypothetical protein PKD20_00530 [Candidatus Saccharibacteria bacterium]|jgi:hypothetical protein|nr:hypothetical protein [Candidatus Saccharibacteria bacterium]HMT55342.1 hypothetical protein [Candidatus Saccharibacteria bacterium]